MRMICLALCLSLFASLIHAAVMPVELVSGNPHHQVVATDVTNHHCGEMLNSTQDAHQNQPCHGDSYQCCLGLLIAPSVAAIHSSDFSELHISKYSSLTLQPMINFIYRPPKA